MKIRKSNQPPEATVQKQGAKRKNQTSVSEFFTSAKRVPLDEKVDTTNLRAEADMKPSCADNEKKRRRSSIEVIEVKIAKGKKASSNKKSNGMIERDLDDLQNPRPSILLDHTDFAPVPTIHWFGSEPHADVREPELRDRFRPLPTKETAEADSVLESSKRSHWTSLVLKKQEQHLDDELVRSINILSAGSEPRCSSPSARMWYDQICGETGIFWKFVPEKRLSSLMGFLKKWRRRLDKETAEANSSKSKMDKKERMKSKRRTSDVSDGYACESDEDYNPDGCESDEDYNPDGEVESMTNPLVLYGPTGALKEALVQHCAEQCGFEVLELHPGERRDAETMKRKLQGASTSQRISASTLSTFFGGKKQEAKVDEKPPKKKHTLVLISSVDIFFSSDYDFVPTLMASLEAARIPFIFTAENKLNSSALCQLERMEELEVSKIDRLPEVLQTAALKLGGRSVQLNECDTVCNFFKHDIRKSLSWMQFACASETESSIANLPVDCSPKIADPTEQSVIGRLWEIEPRAVYLDASERLSDRLWTDAHVISEVRPPRNEPAREQELKLIQRSLSYFGTLRSLASDVVPMLQCINKSFEKKMSTGRSRKMQHYFDRVSDDNRMIDGDGSLRPLLTQFHRSLSE